MSSDLPTSNAPSSSAPPGEASAPLPDRFLTALLSAADKRGTRAVVSAIQPPVAVLALPDQGAGVVLFDRGQASADELQTQLDRLLGGQAAGVLYLVLCGGDVSDQPVLKLADRRAPDPKRLGVYQLLSSGHLAFIAGRRLGLLPEAAKLLGAVSRPLDRAALVANAERAQRAQEEAMTFATALEGRPQTATRVLGAACIVYFALSQYWGQRGNFTEALIQMGANSALLVRAGEPWRLLSHAFLHNGVVHLLVNLMALWIFGSFLEGLLGWRRYLLLYGLAALAGGVGSALIAGVGLSVGASGAIWGLMAAGVALVRRGQNLLPEVVASRLRPRLLVVLAVNVGVSILPLLLPGGPRIDLYAHFGGGLLGFVLVSTGLLTGGLAPAGPAPQASPVPLAAATAAPVSGPGAADDPRFIRVGALIMILLLLGSLAMALAQGRPWEPLGIFPAAHTI